MELRVVMTVFASVFVAELGDKTQLATLLFAADKQVAKWAVFAGSASALVLASAIGVLAGGFVSEHVNVKYLHYCAGAGFVAIGVGWSVAARTVTVPFQIPALVSGGLGGLLLVAIGTGLANIQVRRRLAAAERADAEAVLEAVAAVLAAAKSRKASGASQ